MHATVAATAADSNGFLELGLNENIVQALRDVGYEAPTPIQAATIPAILAGTDVLGQAQTGTGKTGAFALPILSKIDVTKPQTQAMVLVPTRELAIQVAEAFQRYATHMKGFHVLPIYGGQSYTPQLKGLKRGAHVIVGTPGRVMDHMKRGTLPLDAMTFLVLDEADEMLQMGFIDAIEWILEQSPPTRQIALFSATVPPAIRRIAQRHLRSAQEITIRSKTSTAPNIRQRYWLVSGMHKLDALTRILEVETFDAMLVFVRTKLETVELAERLEARGFEAAPLNGDIPQQHRERTIAALKSGKVDIVVATDVAARGLDVERISHVVNYDVPYDSESYIHRIGRTGRAGRSGEAILFIAPRERNMLRIIERATRQQITQMNLPSVAAVNEQRVARFKQRIADTLADGEMSAFRTIVEEFQAEHDASALDVAAALASLLQGSTPLLLPERPESEQGGREWGRRDDQRGGPRERSSGGSDRTRGRGANDRPRENAAERPRREFSDRPRGEANERPRQEFNDRPHGEAKDRPRQEFNDRPRGDTGERARGTASEHPRRDANGYARSADVEQARSDANGYASSAPSGSSEHAEANAHERARGATNEHAQHDASEQAQGDANGNAPSASGSGDHVHSDASELTRVNAREQSLGEADNGLAAVDISEQPRADADRRQPDDATDRPRGNTQDRARSDANGHGPSGSVDHRRGDTAASPVTTVGENAVGDANARPARGKPDDTDTRPSRRKRGDDTNDVVFETFRLEVGHTHGVKPGNIVGAIANEAGLEGRHIGQVDIRDDHSFVDLPEGMPKDIFRNLKKVRVVGQELRISRVDGKPPRQH